MMSVPARKSAPVGVPQGIKAALATLNEFVSQLADMILWLETERGELPDEAILRYVHEAVTVEIGHRRRALELTRALAAIERQTSVPSVRPPATAVAAARSADRSMPVPVRALTPIPSGRADVEDAFYGALLAERASVHLRCVDGYEIPSAVVRDVSADALLVDTPDGLELLLKRSVISIVRS